jgi:Leucine-rich repeat (LRR) protein
MTKENIDELYWKLKESYSDTNLNKIAHNLIRLYREKEFEKLQVIAEIVSGEEQIESVTNKQGFSKLISIYHPDRIQYYHNELDRYISNGDPEILHRLEHVLLILNIEEIVANIDSLQDIDYCPEFKWDVNEANFTIFTVSPKKSEFKRKHKSSKAGCTFYDAVKIRMYGNTFIEFPSNYFEDMDEIEMAESDIDNLDGVEYCIHTETMDLSGNRISDLSPLYGLTMLKDLNLADNQIGDIDALGTLQHLRSIDLSNNRIDDLSPLFELGKLEYIDLTGNKISHDQLNVLKGKGVVVNANGL